MGKEIIEITKKQWERFVKTQGGISKNKKIQAHTINSSVTNYLTDISPKTTIDPSFQRNGGWSEIRRKEFMLDILEHANIPTNFYICDIKQCMNSATDDETRSYFKYFFDRGYKYLSVDGNNRTVTLLHFFNEELLSEDELEILSDINLHITLYTSITVKGVSREFDRINNSLGQSNQTARNAKYNSEFTKYIQDVANNMKSFDLFLSKGALKAHGASELVARCFLMFDNNGNGNNVTGMLTKDVDSMYQKYEFRSPSESKFNKFSRFIKRLDNAMKRNEPLFHKNGDIKDKKIITGQTYFLNPFLLLMTEYNNKPIDLDSFIDIYFDVESKLRTNDKYVYNNAVQSKTCIKGREKSLLEELEDVEDEFLLAEMA